MTSIYDSPLAKRIMLVDLNPYDVDAGAVVQKYVASEFYTTEPTDSPANTTYVGCCMEAPIFKREMFNGTSLRGFANVDRGSFRIVNTLEPGRDAARFEDWFNSDKFTWDGRGCQIYIIEDGTPYSGRTKVFDGIIEDIDYSENFITFRLRSKQYLMDKFMQETRYAGTGNAEGSTTLKGSPKPLCFGQCFNVAPVLVDAANQIFQVHDGAIQSIDAARDKGVALSDQGNVSGYSNLAATSPASGQYYTAHNVGMIKVGGTLAGQLTIDVQGSTLGGTYSAKVADICEYITDTYTDISDFDSTALAALNTAAGQTVGLYSNDDMNVQEALDLLAGSIGAFYGFSREGEFTMGRYEGAAVTPDLSIDDMDILEGTLQVTTFGAPVFRATVRYRPNYAQQNPDNLAGSVSQANRELYGKDYLYETDENTAIQTKFLNSYEQLFDTLLYSSSAAAAEATRLLALYDDKLEVITADTNLKPLQVDVNQTLNITHERYGLSAGKNFVIIGFEEDYLDGRVRVVAIG